MRVPPLEYVKSGFLIVIEGSVVRLIGGGTFIEGSRVLPLALVVVAVVVVAVLMVATTCVVGSAVVIVPLSLVVVTVVVAALTIGVACV